MADSNHVRRDDYMQFSENDPFAELTRIMGHDPRGQQQPAAPMQEEEAAATEPAVDDLALDLERELAADLDFSDFDEPALQEDWRTQAQPVEHAGPVQSEPVAFDAEFDAFFAEIAEKDEGVAEVAPQPVDISASISNEMADSLDDVLERELFAGQDEYIEPVQQPVYDAPAYEAQQAEPVYEAAQTEGINDASQAEPVYNASHAEPAYSAHEAEPVYEPDAPHSAVPAYGDVAEPVAADDWAAEAEFDIDFLERELAAVTSAPVAPLSEFEPQHPAMTPPPASFEGEPFPEEEEVVFEPVAQVGEEATDRPLSLEEELNLLLADEPLPTPLEVAPPSQTTATSFGRANFTAPQPPANPAPMAMSNDRFEETAAAAAPAFAMPTPPAATSYEPAPAEPAEAVADDGLDHLFGDDFALEFDDTIEAEPAASATAELPEIETVEVAEIVPPVNDDLDIPEVAYDVPAAATTSDFHDDFQTDFAHLFGDTGITEAAPVAAAAGVAAASTAPEQSSQASYVLDDTQWQAAQNFPDSGFDYETDLEQAISMSAYEEEPVQPSRRRGVLVAAVIGGLVVLGGAGVLGMSMLGGGSDTPAIVRADPDPMKVRPENPGGTTVPNQDNEVYQRVSGASSNDGPQQEQLITSAEEPMDVAASTAPREIPAALAPGGDDDVAAPVKSEERIEPTSEATSPVEAQETAMVTPRRVRTMVVRPDGTMVPREEPAVAESAVGIQQPVVAGEAAPLAPVGQPIQSTEEIDAGPTIEMPQTVAVVPTQRSAATQPVAAQPAPAQPVAPQPAAPAPVAATPVSAPAAAASAATSEWSMQIASQPTAEGAQSSYQDLARRYGSVLEGRGVNIVRADIDGRGTYYRVRIPASSRDEAIQLCTRYKAAGGSCFVSR